MFEIQRQGSITKKSVAMCLMKYSPARKFAGLSTGVNISIYFFIPSHSSCILSRKHEHGIIQLCKPPHSPDIAPSDFWLLSKLETLKLHALKVIPNKNYEDSFKKQQGLKECVEQSHGNYFEGCFLIFSLETHYNQFNSFSAEVEASILFPSNRTLRRALQHNSFFAIILLFFPQHVSKPPSNFLVKYVKKNSFFILLIITHEDNVYLLKSSIINHSSFYVQLK